MHNQASIFLRALRDGRSTDGLYSEEIGDFICYWRGFGLESQEVYLAYDKFLMNRQMAGVVKAVNK